MLWWTLKLGDQEFNMTVREITQKIELTQALETVSFAYSEFAGQKLVTIRQQIEKNRSFVSELSNVFHIVKQAAEAKGQKTDLGKKGTVNLLITSNKRFYGGLERRLLDFFLAHSVLSYGKTYVIGDTGMKYLAGENFSLPYENLPMHGDVPSLEEISKIVNLLAPYLHINVYHVRMQSVLVQKPVVLEIGGIADIPKELDPREVYYIFEPELVEMLKFFDRKIVQILLAQAFYESELARTAARMVSMEQSKINAERDVKQLQKKLFQERGNIATFRMMDIIAGAQVKKQI